VLIIDVTNVRWDAYDGAVVWSTLTQPQRSTDLRRQLLRAQLERRDHLAREHLAIAVAVRVEADLANERVVGHLMNGRWAVVPLRSGKEGGYEAGGVMATVDGYRVQG
jgi:hypothetical protein